VTPTRLRVRFESSPRTTQILIAPGALSRLGAFVRGTTGASRVVLIADARVARLWGEPVARSLRAARLEVTALRVPPGERSKRPGELARLWRGLARARLGRDGAVIAFGGGVAGDLAGFAAATWLRGVPWICVPTTLLAQVDSGIGGKTAVDLPEGKNLVGAFHQPLGVLVDPAVLATLPARHVRAGLVEVVKMGFATDAALFRWCERNAAALARREPAALAQAVARGIRAKARVVAADEREREGGGRTALNFGHTLGHAIEAALGYRRLLHGEAVAIGVRVAAELSEHGAGLAPRSRVRLEALLERLGAPTRMPPLAIRALLVAMANDKKRRGGSIRWVLTPRIGAASVPRAVPNSLVHAALRRAGARGGRP